MQSVCTSFLLLWHPEVLVHAPVLRTRLWTLLHYSCSHFNALIIQNIMYHVSSFYAYVNEVFPSREVFKQRRNEELSFHMCLHILPPNPSMFNYGTKTITIPFFIILHIICTNFLSISFFSFYSFFFHFTFMLYFVLHLSLYLLIPTFFRFTFLRPPLFFHSPFGLFQPFHLPYSYSFLSAF